LCAYNLVQCANISRGLIAVLVTNVRYAVLITSERLYVFSLVLTLVAFCERLFSIFWHSFAWCCS